MLTKYFYFFNLYLHYIQRVENRYSLFFRCSVILFYFLRGQIILVRQLILNFTEVCAKLCSCSVRAVFKREDIYFENVNIYVFVCLFTIKLRLTYWAENIAEFMLFNMVFISYKTMKLLGLTKTSVKFKI